MKILSKRSEYGRNVVTVQLGPEDIGRTDKEMVTAADSYGEYGKAQYHFGGTVKRLEGGRAEITVYTD